MKGEDVTEANDKGVLKEIIEEGNDDNEVNEGSKVNVNIVGKYDGQEFDNRNVEFIVGEGYKYWILFKLFIQNNYEVCFN